MELLVRVVAPRARYGIAIAPALAVAIDADDIAYGVCVFGVIFWMMTGSEPNERERESVGLGRAGADRQDCRRDARRQTSGNAGRVDYAAMVSTRCYDLTSKYRLMLANAVPLQIRPRGHSSPEADLVASASGEACF
ncbi:hypothetical protein PENSPDRAFT_671097 [Peniophora sp. CONT]|nr:hypothetical protein PENSPDRAFT_671097 [Peniophora sp. CONT]